MSVVRAVDGQDTGLSALPAEQPTSDRHRPGLSSSEGTGPGFSAFKHQPTDQLKRTRPVTSYPVSQSRVLSTNHEAGHVFSPTRKIGSAFFQNSKLGKPFVGKCLQQVAVPVGIDIMAYDSWRPCKSWSWRQLIEFKKKIQMETPETIRTSLQQGEWVTSVDFKDAYFHIPIQEQSRKYLRFLVQGRTYQFKALPFGLSTAPM